MTRARTLADLGSASLATTADLTAHASETSSIHGIADTGTLALTDDLGLVPITPTSVNGTGTSLSGHVAIMSNSPGMNIEGVFSSAYTNYRIIVNHFGGGASMHLVARLRTGGSNITSSYTYGFSRVNSSGTPNYGASGSTGGWLWGETENGQQRNFTVDLAYPHVLGHFPSFVMQSADAQNYGRSESGYLANTSSCDGLNLYPSSATITAYVRIYGYK